MIKIEETCKELLKYLEGCLIVSQVVMKNTSRLCSTKPIVTINGNFPGPTIYAREDDTVLVKVVNHVKYNVSIHWYAHLLSNFAHIIVCSYFNFVLRLVFHCIDMGI